MSNCTSIDFTYCTLHGNLLVRFAIVTQWCGIERKARLLTHQKGEVHTATPKLCQPTYSLEFDSYIFS